MEPIFSDASSGMSQLLASEHNITAFHCDEEITSQSKLCFQKKPPELHPLAGQTPIPLHHVITRGHGSRDLATGTKLSTLYLGLQHIIGTDIFAAKASSRSNNVSTIESRCS